MKIKNQSFESDSVELDGNSFENCRFVNCMLIFRAKAPVQLTDCTFLDVRWNFLESAALTADFIRQLSQASGDYGKFTLVNTFPVIKDWLRPEILEKLN